MNCPVCANTDLVISERQGIEIDYCPKCRGVWLDRGELDKIIDRTVDSTEVKSYPRDESNYYNNKKYSDDYYKQKKRKSILGELFDF